MVSHARFSLQAIKVTIAVVTIFALSVSPARAQTPTPWPSPTPDVVNGEFVVIQAITYGDGGIILGLLFLGGVLLIDIVLKVGERITDR